MVRTWQGMNMGSMMGFRRVLGWQTMRNLIKTFIVMLMLSFSHASIARDLVDGLTATEKGDFATALRLWTPLAEQGDALAQLFLGLNYAEGKGVVQNYKIAAKWFTLAAEQGIAKAQSKLGAMYADGQGVAQDYLKAHMWFNIAAIDGNSEDAASKRDKISKKMTPAQVEKAQEAASLCIKQNFKSCDF